VRGGRQEAQKAEQKESSWRAKKKQKTKKGKKKRKKKKRDTRFFCKPRDTNSSFFALFSQKKFIVEKEEYERKEETRRL
jgi:hypothetical protein